MRYATVCSGIEAPSAAWHSLGFKPVFFSEIEKFPSAVLAHHYPTTPNLGDMTKIDGNKYNRAVDLICGGTPCQSFSVAGLRQGLSDPRGNLALEFLRLVDQIRPKWVLWENVPGVLSSNKGRDFGSFLGALGQLGYGWAYRVLDAQYFGVPQRRRRVFVVGHIGGQFNRAAAVLFEPESMRRNIEPRQKSGQATAAGIGESTGVFRYQNKTDGLVKDTIAATLKRSGGTTDERSVSAFIMSTGQANAEILPDKSPCLNCNHEAPIIFGWQNSQSQGDSCGTVSPSLDKSKVPAVYAQRVAPTLTKGSHNSGPGVSAESAESLISVNDTIRRLTPLECERLQGFPDNYTLIPYNGRMAADGPRYAAIGNSMAKPVMEWLGERILKVDAI